jgi:hypothetical protein
MTRIGVTSLSLSDLPAGSEGRFNCQLSSDYSRSNRQGEAPGPEGEIEIL